MVRKIVALQLANNAMLWSVIKQVLVGHRQRPPFKFALVNVRIYSENLTLISALIGLNVPYFNLSYKIQ